MYSKADALKELRKAAKELGFTFKQSDVKLNGSPLYKLVHRKTGDVLVRNYQFNSAYEDMHSGYWESLVKKAS